jgi:hypothetical protein
MKTLKICSTGSSVKSSFYRFLFFTLLILPSFFTEINAQTTYYSKSGQTDPNNVSNWTTNTNGSGSSPTDFTASDVTFVVQSGHTYTLTANWTVGGNLQISGGTLIIASGTTARSLTVNGNLSMSSGTLNLSSGTSTSANGTINLKGNLVHTGGTLTETGSSTASTILINGTTLQTIESTGTAGATNVLFTISQTTASGVCEIASGKTFVSPINGAFTVQDNTSTTSEFTIKGTFKKGSGAFDFQVPAIVASGGVFDLNGSSCNCSTSSISINGDGISSGGALINSGAGDPTYSGGVTLQSDASVGGNGDLRLSGVISGNFNLKKVGANTVFLSSSSNSFGGSSTTLDIQSGMIRLPASSGTWSGFFGNTNKSVSLGASSTSGSIWFQDSGSPSLSFPLTSESGGGTFQHATNGTVTLSQNITLNGTFTAKVEHSTYSAPTLNGSGRIAISGVMSGAGGFTSYSTAIAGNPITLSSSNTYTGTTTINTGQLTLGIANALPVGSNAGLIRFGGVAGGTPTLNLGAFNLGSGTGAANSAGALDFDVNTTINLATSGSYNYYFKASEGQTWDATTITVNNWSGIPGLSSAGRKIFIGSSASLTATQLGKISFTGYTGCMQLSSGEIIPTGGLNPGFETSDNTGWTLESTSVTWTNTSTAGYSRSGSRGLASVMTTDNSRAASHNTRFSITLPSSNTNYVHVIGYAKHITDGENGLDQCRVRALGTSTITGSLVNLNSANGWTRMTASGTGTNGGEYYPGFQLDPAGASPSGGTYALDDIIIYTSTSASVDLTAPNAPSSLSSSESGSNVQVSWTAGTDNATNTSGIDGVLLLRTAGSGKSAPTPNNQAWYSTSSGVGPTSIVNGADTWTVLSNSNPSASFVDANASYTSEYTYAIYMRDKAFNYSSAATVNYIPCINPTSGGTIAGGETICSGGDPAAFTSSAVASGNYGTLEYKWQYSSTSDFSSDINDIASSNSTTYDASSGLTATTYYRRLARVSCKSDWTGAVASNILTVTVNNNPVAPTASAQSFCSAASPTVASLSAAGTAIQWYDASTNGNLLTSGTALSTGTYYATQTVSNCESTTRTSVAVTVIPSGTWIGDNNDNWNVANNWCGSIPDIASEVVVIPSGVTVTLDLSPTISSLTLSSGATIDLGSNTVTIANNGAFINNGSIDSGTGTVAFAGTGTLGGTSSSTLNNLTVNGALTINTSPTINGTVTMNNGGSILSNPIVYGGSASLVYNNVGSINSTNNEWPASDPPYNVTLQNTSNVTLNGAKTILGALTLTSGDLILGSHNLTLGASATVSAASNSSHVNASSTGELRKIYNGNSSFEFPVGDGTNLTPAIVNFTAGSSLTGASDDYLGVRLTNSKVSGLPSDNINFLNRSWFIEPGAGISGFTYTVSLKYADADVNGTESEIIPIKKSSGGEWTYPSNVVFSLGTYIPNSSSNGTDHNNNTLVWSGVTSFSEFGGGGQGTALPVELISFLAECSDQNMIHVSWSTASEHNSDYFIIEKSRDGSNWVKLETLKASGFSNSKIDYEIADLQPISGANYYRLLQFDVDGHFELYGPIAATCEIDESIDLSVYPNPFNSDFYVSIPVENTEGSGVISVNDLSGRQLLSNKVELKKGINIYYIDGKDLPSGVYQIIFTDEKNAFPKISRTIKMCKI